MNTKLLRDLPGGARTAHDGADHEIPDRFKFSLGFYGRKRGAIGSSYWIRAVRVAETQAEAQAALYDEYEDISGVTVFGAERTDAG